MSCGDTGDVPGDQPKAEALMPRRKNVRRVEKGICQRCREAKSKFIIRSATYCTACFETNVFSRFTRQLYPPLHPPSKDRPTSKNLYRPARRRTNVAVALSGGAGSMCMLDMLARGGYIGDGTEKMVDKTKGEKDVVWMRGYAVYVEFAGVIEGGEDRTAWMREVAESRGLEFVGMRAEDVFDAGLVERLGGVGGAAVDAAFHVDLKDTALPITPKASSSLPPLEKLRNLLSSLPAPSRPALLSNILTSLLNTAISCLPDISHLLLGETATRQSQRVISATASGRGWALPLELSGSTTLPSGVVRIAPMKDLSLKEAAFSCKIRGIEMRNRRDWDRAGAVGGDSRRDARGKGGAMSIEGLTEQFIAALNVTHPATVSTITRTGDKLVFPGGSERDKLCPLCQMPVDPSALEWKARTGLTSLGKTAPGSVDGSTEDAKRAEPDDNKGVDLAPRLCYSCLTTMTHVSHRKDPVADHVELPLWVGEKVAVGQAAMKAKLEGYLLDEEDESEESE